MFGRAKVLIRNYENGREFERAATKLARRGYEVAEINGERAALTLDPAAGAYVPRPSPATGGPTAIGLPVIVTYVRAGHKAARGRASLSQG